MNLLFFPAIINAHHHISIPLGGIHVGDRFTSVGARYASIVARYGSVGARYTFPSAAVDCWNCQLAVSLTLEDNFLDV